MNLNLIATIVGALAASAGAYAQAATVIGINDDTVSYSPWGPTSAPGDQPVTIWAASSPNTAGLTITAARSDSVLALAPGYTLTGSGSAQIVQGNFGYSANPAFGPNFSDRDARPYLSIEGGQSANTFATLTTPGDRHMSFYVGSLDAYNTITFTYANHTTETFDGGDLVNAISAQPGSFPYGDQQSSQSNGLLTFNFASPVTQVVFGSETTNAFEIANISGAVPEPATWAMMLVGVVGLGAAMRSARRQQYCSRLI